MSEIKIARRLGRDSIWTMTGKRKRVWRLKNPSRARDGTFITLVSDGRGERRVHLGSGRFRDIIHFPVGRATGLRLIAVKQRWIYMYVQGVPND